MNTITLKLAVLALLATACSTAHAGLEWSLSTNTINNNNTADADLEVVFSVTASDATLDAIRTADYGPSPQCGDDCDTLGQYSVNFSIDALGDAAGNAIVSTVSDLIGGFTVQTGLLGGDPESLTRTDGASPTDYTYVYVSGAGPSLMSLFSTSDKVDVLKLSIDIDSFADAVDVSDIGLVLKAGEFPTQTQFGEFGSLEAADELFFASPSANMSDPGFGDTVTQTYSVDPAAIPEPSSFAYMGLFTLCVTGVRWYRRRKQA